MLTDQKIFLFSPMLTSETIRRPYCDNSSLENMWTWYAQSLNDILMQENRVNRFGDILESFAKNDVIF